MAGGNWRAGQLAGKQGLSAGGPGLRGLLRAQEQGPGRTGDVLARALGCWTWDRWRTAVAGRGPRDWAP